MSDWRVVHGDSLEVLRGLGDNTVDALVCDPPAGISFMNKAFDSDRGGRDQWIAWLASILAECLRVMKPGAHGLVWALPRTSHWTGLAIESAGLQVRDRISHLFGSGFPKSHNLPGGIGTALKPAAEDWWLCRKPLAGTVAQTVARWGTGGLNIDASRIGGTWTTWRRKDGSINPSAGFADEYVNGDERPTDVRNPEHPAGRWPANCVLSCDCPDESRHEASCPVRLLDEQSGERPGGGKAGSRRTPSSEEYWGNGGGGYTTVGRSASFHHDTGGASRFYYTAKASRREREAGLEGEPSARRSTGYGSMRSRECNVCGTRAKEAGPDARWPNCEHDDWRWVEQESEGVKGGNARNHHPCVKPLSLMKWLVRLVTPPRGLVLDPFTGSGSTGCAAVMEGFRFLGIEQDESYCEIARRRIAHWAAQRSPQLEPELFAEPAA